MAISGPNPTNRIPYGLVNAKIPDNHRDSDPVCHKIWSNQLIPRNISEEREKKDVTSCVFEGTNIGQKASGDACREQGGVPVDINAASGPFTPAGTDTKIISSSAAYENNAVKHRDDLVPRCRSFCRKPRHFNPDRVFALLLVFLHLFFNHVRRIRCKRCFLLDM